MRPTKVEVSHRTIIFAIFFLLLLWFLYFVRDVILTFFIALLIMTILNPLVTRLSKLKIPRTISVVVIYILFFTLLGVLVASVIPPMADQTSRFAEGLPSYVEGMGLPKVLSDQVINDVGSIIAVLPGAIAKFTVSFFSNLFGIFATFIIALYLLISRDRLDDQLGTLFIEKQMKHKVGRVIDDIEKRLGGWARGQFTIMLLIGVMTYLGLEILGIPFSLPIAITAGLLEIVPYIGPIVAAVPMAIAGFTISPLMGATAIVLAILIQQIDNLFITPKIMSKSVGLSPIIILLALAIGSKLAGMAGILIAVPVLITSQILFKEFLVNK